SARVVRLRGDGRSTGPLGTDFRLGGTSLSSSPSTRRHWTERMVLLRPPARLARSEHSHGDSAVLHGIRVARLRPRQGQIRGPIRTPPRWSRAFAAHRTYDHWPYRPVLSACRN